MVPEGKRVLPRTPEHLRRRLVYDFGWARGDEGLRDMLASLDQHGYELVCVTHVCSDCYKVFFRRPAP